MGSGKVSGPTPDSCGSLLELAWNGQRPITLSNGAQRSFIEDGDEVEVASRRGAVRTEDVCDAHPELVRAAKHVGEPVGRPCPICADDQLVLVSYVFGPGLPSFGRCITSAKELKALQKENGRLKKLVADQALDMEILKEAAKGNW